MENKHVQKVKKMFDENNLDLAEGKLDRAMDKMAQISRVQKLIQHKRMQTVLNSTVAHDFNKHIAPHLQSIFLVIGWISIISGILGIFSFLLGLSGLGFVFSFGAGMGIRVVIYILIALAFALLSVVCGIGMIRMKRRLPSLIFIGFLVSVVALVISLIPSGFLISAKYGSFGGSFFNVILTFILVVIVFKNKQLFHK